jgi:glutamate-ammonia-ligase adenylyltransferase
METFRSLCPGVDEDIIRDFLSRMDPEYFEQFDPGAVAQHIHMAGQLDPDHPCRVSISLRPDGSSEVVVVAYDYFSEFAGICGLLSAFDLDIREGSIYTFRESAASGSSLPPHPSIPAKRRQQVRPGITRKKIVDVFHVFPLAPDSFTPERQRQFVIKLETMMRLLDEQSFTEARRMVERGLVETLGKRRSTFSGLLNPIDIRFDNQASDSDTVMDIRSLDTPAFLFALSNALAMRGIYIHKARFAQIGGTLHDRFWIRGRHGHKIDTPREQQELQVTAALIKQFTHFLAWAPDPAKAMEHFDLFLDRILEERTASQSDRALDFLKDKKTLTLLARLLGTSDFLWEDFLRRQHANLLPVLEDYQSTPLIRSRDLLAKELKQRVARGRSDEEKRRALNQYKDRELFRIDMVHLMDSRSTLQNFSLALTELAEVVLGQATRDCEAALAKLYGMPRLAGGKRCPLAIFGLGKFGGRELGYASDIEVLFAYGGPGHTSGPAKIDNGEYFERLIQSILQRIDAQQEAIFHLDVRLRPHGGKGLLCNTIEELRKYYSADGLAAPFERQALIKLRHVAGSDALGQQGEAHRDLFVYSDLPWDLDVALDLRRRQVHELVQPGETNVKYSPGGLIEVEYAVQYLQLMHGYQEPRVRSPNTLEALEGLRECHFLDAKQAEELRQAYIFFRLLIDGLRIVRGHAKDLVLPPQDSDEFIFLARRLGYQAEEWEEGAARLSREITLHMTRTRQFFAARFRPAEPKPLTVA